jgi:hypothetical protein
MREVLRLAVGPEPLIALIPVLLAQFFGIERARHPATFRVQLTRHRVSVRLGTQYRTVLSTFRDCNRETVCWPL